jgi:hypothetical protein
MKQEIKLNHRMAITRTKSHQITGAVMFNKFYKDYVGKDLTIDILVQALINQHVKSVQYLSPIGKTWWNIQY